MSTVMSWRQLAIGPEYAIDRVLLGVLCVVVVVLIVAYAVDRWRRA